MDSSDRRYLIIGIVAGLVLGILLGMVLFWGLFPVKWTDANTYDLSSEARAKYMALVADSFRLDKDPASAERYLESWTMEEKQQALTDAAATYQQAGQMDKVQAVDDLALALAISPSVEGSPTPPAVEAPASGIWNRLRVPCLVFVLVLLALVLALLGIRYFLKRRSPAPGVAPSEQPAPAVLRTEEPVAPQQAPLGHFFTTYQLGEDTYDESFSIEAPTGEFLGECGMGISETIGEGEPDKVTAFEVWLFDKSDIRTVTKVLMSEHAYHDDALRAKLAPKGDAVLAQPGAPITLETSGLQVIIDITTLVYGEGELPPNSFFAELTVKLLARARPVEASTGVF